MAFLAQPSIEAAHEAYLASWKLPTVRERWNGRKPTLKQFVKAFGKDYQKAQARLESESSNGVDVNVLAQAILGLQEQITALTGQDDDPEPEQDDEDDSELTDLLAQFGINVEDEDEQDEDTDEPIALDRDDAVESLMALMRGKANGSVKGEADDQQAKQERRVRPENEDELPTTALVYWYLHRAREAGQEFAIVPVRRIVASQGREMGENGKSIDTIIRSLRQKKH